MNNYQAQQTWDSFIGFTTFAIMAAFMVGMTKDLIGKIVEKEPVHGNPGLAELLLHISDIMARRGVWVVKEDGEIWLRVPPLERVDIVGQTTYKGKSVILLSNLLFTSPVFCLGSKICADKEFYDKAPYDILTFVLDHELEELKLAEKGVSVVKAHEEIAKLEDPVLREKALNFWVNMVAKRLIEMPGLREETFDLWDDGAKLLKARMGIKE